MRARDAILGRIRSSLTGEADQDAPSYELWPQGTWTAPTDLFACFADELHRVQGESKRFKSVGDAEQFLEKLHRELGKPRAIFVDHPTCRQLVQAIEGACFL